jgi:hypothetical protein
MSTPTEDFLAPLTAFVTVSARSNLDSMSRSDPTAQACCFRPTANIRFA